MKKLIIIEITAIIAAEIISVNQKFAVINFVTKIPTKRLIIRQIIPVKIS
jgi:hypothetical protein